MAGMILKTQLHIKRDFSRYRSRQYLVVTFLVMLRNKFTDGYFQTLSLFSSHLRYR